MIASDSSTTLNKQLSDIEQRLGYLTLGIDDFKAQEVLDWLCEVDTNSAHEAACAKRDPQTCGWLFDRPEFRAWEARGSILWINGDGKYLSCQIPFSMVLLFVLSSRLSTCFVEPWLITGLYSWSWKINSMVRFLSDVFEKISNPED